MHAGSCLRTNEGAKCECVGTYTGQICESGDMWIRSARESNRNIGNVTNYVHIDVILTNFYVTF